MKPKTKIDNKLLLKTFKTKKEFVTNCNKECHILIEWHGNCDKKNLMCLRQAQKHAVSGHYKTVSELDLKK
jgi:hypothetical protein